MRSAIPVGLAVALLLGAGCKSYEYEEEVFLEVDGSGSFRVSGSLPALSLLHGMEAPSESELSRYFTSGSSGVEVTSVRRTERSGRVFLHLQADFDDWNEVCRQRAFRSRKCELSVDEGGDRLLEVVVPPPASSSRAREELPNEELMALRFHFPSTVIEHNAPEGVERGNILGWERTLARHVSAPPLEVRARFDERSVLDATVRILALAAAAVAGSVALALTLMVRKGRRQLREETRVETARAAAE